MKIIEKIKKEVKKKNINDKTKFKKDSYFCLLLNETKNDCPQCLNQIIHVFLLVVAHSLFLQVELKVLFVLLIIFLESEQLL